jgi:hypothetical protein
MVLSEIGRPKMGGWFVASGEREAGGVGRTEL